MNLRKSERKQARIKMGIQGPSGSGKTYSALLLAYGLIGDWKKIAVIDTENNSSDLYAHLGDFQVLPLKKPFSPERYAQAIKVCDEAGAKVILIDSISQEWEGQGGILDVHSSLTGNSFVNWYKITPRHNAFVNAILEAPCHVIATIRSKQDYVLSEKNGKYVPEKVGMKGVTREGMDYELTLVLELDLKHNCTASKDRTGLFMDRPAFVITPETGRKIHSWCNTGISLIQVKEKIGECNNLKALIELYNKYPEYQEQLKPDFAARKLELEESSVQNIKIGNNGITSNK